jgi:hypothetical protein
MRNFSIFKILSPGMAGWDEDEDSDSDGEPLQVATGGSLYHGLSVLRCVMPHTLPINMTCLQGTRGSGCIRWHRRFQDICYHRQQVLL